MLDTFTMESVLPESAILKLPNGTLMPHTTIASLKTIRIAASKIVEEVRRWLSDEPQLNPC